ncbi:MAG: ABC transporter ATP-binding protein [bacterium]
MDIIETKALTKIYFRGLLRQKIHAVNDLNLKVTAGEIFGFLGPNGAGKTTTIKILMGFLLPTSGDAALIGKPLHDVSVRRRIGYLSENPIFHDFLTGRQAIEFYGGLHGIPKKQAHERLDWIVTTLRLRDELILPLKKHSRGMLQKIGLAQALVNDPDLYILDEPTSGLDPIGRKDFYNTMIELKNKGKTIFFSSHIMADVEMVCDRVGILVNGKLTCAKEVAPLRGSLEELFIDEIRKHHPEGKEL